MFTPERERSESADAGAGGSNENRLSVRDGMDAVVGFLTGLLPGAMASKTSLEPSESGGTVSAHYPQDYSPPASPFPNRNFQGQVRGGGYDLAEPPTPTTMTSSTESLGEPTPRFNRLHNSRISNTASTVNPHAPRTYSSQRPPPLLRTPSQLSHASQQVQKQSSRSSLHHQAVQQHSNILSPRPSRPNAYLRHMGSASSMPPRPNSTPAHMSRPAIFVSDNDSNSTHTLRVKPHNDDEPPLPPSWLESVARAVLFGGNGAYVGGPSTFISHQSHTSSSSRPVLRSSRSSLSQASSRKSKYQRQPMNRRSGLSDQTNSSTTPTPGDGSPFLVPPPLVSQIERGRSRRSEGEVSMTRVVCRSAPGSRNTSATRSGGIDDGKGRRRKGDNARKKKEEKGRLPSLARTQTEGDVWDREKSEARPRGNHNSGNRYLSGWGADVDSEAGSNASSEEEEDGELDLARILVPPKRQNSIKSLRKHLASETGPIHTSLNNYAARTGSTGRRAGRGLNVPFGGNDKPSRVPNILQRRWTDEDMDGESQEEWGGGWVRQGAGNRESEDDDVDSFVGFFGEGRTSLGGTSKSRTGGNRLGFNGAWGLKGGNGS